MPDCISHHYVLGEPAGDRVPGECKECGAKRDWPAWGKVMEGRPFLVRDPLLRRITGQFGLPAYY